MSLESKFKATLCKQLQDLGAMIHVISATADSSGWPDRYIVHPGWSGYIEFKAIRGRLRENQRLTLKGITKRKQNALILWERGADNYELLYVGGTSGDIKSIAIAGATDALYCYDGKSLLEQLRYLNHPMFKNIFAEA